MSGNDLSESGSETQLIHETVSGNSGNHPRPCTIVPDYYPDMIQDARFLRAGFVPSEVVHREIRASAGALLIRGLPDPEVGQVIDELETGREVLS